MTVLFTDVVDSMGIERQLGDPEEMRNLMDRLFVTTCEVVERFGGTVQRFTGDGAMVIFGAPVAHEDHALRACRAAAELLERVRASSDIALRIGVNSGEVVTATVGEGGFTEWTAFGPTVGLAKRAESHGRPGTIALTEPTARLVGDRVRLRELGELEGGPLYAIESIEESLDEPHPPPMVGRERELALLQEAIGRDAAVTVWGEPGVGKTRLCEAFGASCRASGARVEFVRGLAHAGSVPLLPFAQLLRRRLSLDVSAEPAAARARLAAVLEREPGAAREQSLLEDLLGIADPGRPLERVDPEARRRRLFAAIEALVFGADEDAAAAEGQRILIVEDLHWLDRASGELARAFVEAGRTLVVASARREVGVDQLGDRAVELAPLGAEACEMLVDHLLGDDPSLAATRQAVTERSGGNPLFAREIVRALREGSSAALEAPPSVQAVIAARVDHLPPVQKSLLRVAAVAGAGVSEPVLRSVTGADKASFSAALDGLLARDLLRSAGPREYGASHALVEEVTYGALLRATRARLHRAVALALEEHEPDRIDERAAILAAHWERAGEPARAAAMHMRAGTRAAFTDPARAVQDHRRAWELADTLDPGPESLSVRIEARARGLWAAFRAGVPPGDTREQFAAEMARVYEDGLAIAEGAGMNGPAAMLVAAYANLERSLGAAPERIIPLALEADRRATEIGEPGLQITIAPSSVLAWWSAGRSREALTTIDRYLDVMGDDHRLGAGLAVVSPRAFLLQFRGMCVMTLGNVPEGRRLCEQALEIARADRDLEMEMTAHSNLVSAVDHDRDASAVLHHATRNWELAERVGSTLGQAIAYRSLCSAYHHVGEPDRAVEAGRAGVRLLERRGTADDIASFVIMCLSTAHLGRGDVEEALALAQRSLDVALASGCRGYQEIRAHVALAAALTERAAPADLDRARLSLDAADAHIAERGLRLFAPAVWEVRGTVERKDGNELAADAALAHAADAAAEIGAPRRAELLRERMGTPPATLVRPE